MPLLSPDLAARLNRWPRRLAALGCLLLAAGSALASRHRPAAEATTVPGTSVVVAAHPIAVGAVLNRADLAIARWPPALAPAGSTANPATWVGKRAAGPIGRGEAITPTRLVGADLAAGLPAGELAVPVTVADPNSAALVRAGDYVDLICVPDDSIAQAAATPKPVIAASDVQVLAVLPAPDGSSEQAGVGLIVAADHADSLRIAAVATRRMLAVRHQPP